MSNNCVMCGAPVPSGQRTCSMCYGDIGHGRDGYYEEQMRRDQERQQEQEQEQRWDDER